MGKLNLQYVPFLNQLKKQQFIFSAVAQFHKIFGHKLKYYFRIILPFVIYRQSAILDFMEEIQKIQFVEDSL